MVYSLKIYSSYYPLNNVPETIWHLRETFRNLQEWQAQRGQLVVNSVGLNPSSIPYSHCVTKVMWPLWALFLYITCTDDSINTIGLLWGLKKVLPHTWSAKKRARHVENPHQTWSSALAELCFPSLIQIINFSNTDHFRYIKCHLHKIVLAWKNPYTRASRVLSWGLVPSSVLTSVWPWPRPRNTLKPLLQKKTIGP